MQRPLQCIHRADSITTRLKVGRETELKPMRKESRNRNRKIQKEKRFQSREKILKYAFIPSEAKK